MPFLLLLLLFIVLVVDQWPEPVLIGEEQPTIFTCLVLTALTTLFVIGSAAALTYWTRKQVRNHPLARDRIGERYARLRRAHLFAALAIYGLILFALGW